MANKHNNTKHSREYIINTMYEDFQCLIPDTHIEASLVKLGIISSVTRSWLKEHFIDKQLSARECADILGCSLGHIHKKIQYYKLNKKRFGITTSNNKAHRRMIWKRNLQNAQPNRKEVVVFHINSDTPLFECPSIVATSKKLGLAREHIRDCLNPNGRRKTAGGFKFMLKKEYEANKQRENIKAHLSQQITSNISIDELVVFSKG